MATTVTTAGRAVVGESKALTWLTGWIRSHKQVATYLAVALVVALGLFAWSFLTAKTAERSAGRQIAQARLALDSKNYPLAASVLSQVVENFSGTHAAYETAGAAALYPFLRAQFLSDAGRAWLAAGDTAKALAVYRTIAEKLDSTTAAGEAKVRLGELTKGSGHP